MSRRGPIRSARWALLSATVVLATAGTAGAAPGGSVDYERADSAAATIPAAVARARRSERASIGRFALLQRAPRSAGVRAFGRLDGLLTAASARRAADIALDYVRARQDLFGIDAADLSKLELVRHYGAAGIEQLRWAQRYRGITAIDTSLIANLTASGRLVNILGAPRHDLTLDSVTPQISASDAYAGAARALGGPPRSVRRASTGPERETSFGGSAAAKLVIYERGGPQLGWRLTLPVDGTHIYDVLVDATTAVVQRAQNLVESLDASIYRNYPAAPAGGTPELLSIDAYLDPSATTLSGPYAHTFTDADDVVQAPGDAAPAAGEVAPGSYAISDPNAPACALICIWKFGTPNSWVGNREVDATQMQWFLSTYHDYLQNTPAIAFTPAAGNFEGSDRVVAQSMDGARTNAGLPDGQHINNANMATFPDGTSPLMQMYLTSRSGHASSTGFDSSVIYHEYTHGLVGRTITDAGGAEAVSGAQGGAFNEGTADFYAEDYLVGQGLEPDVPAVRDVMLGRFTFHGTLRSEPLDCRVGDGAPCTGGGTGHGGGFTYADFGNVAAIGNPEVHADGEIWGQTMWQLRQVLIDRLTPATGLDHVRRLLTTGMRLVPDNPSFLDLRNAMLQAAAVLDPTGADAADVWHVFAERGMGYFASTTSSQDTQPIADTHLPPAPADPTGTVSGTVTDATTGSPVAGVRVAFTGHDSGIGPDLTSTTSATGAYAMAGVPPGTYPLLRARGGGYAGQSANVVVAPSSVTTKDFSLVRDVAAAAAGAQIASFTGPDYSVFGCGPSGLIDEESDLVWGTTAQSDPAFPGAKEAVVELAAPTELTGISINPAGGCGDDDSAALGQFEVLASLDGTTFTSISTGALVPGDLHRDNAIALHSVPPATRYVKLVARTSQSSAGSGASFIDTGELRAFGTPAVTPPAQPPAEPAPTPLSPSPLPAPPPLPLPSPPADTQAPRVVLSGSRSQQLTPSITVGVRCADEPCTVTASATVRVPAAGGRRATKYRLGPATLNLATAGRRGTLALKVLKIPRRAIRRALTARERVGAKFTIVAKDRFANARTLTRTIAFRR